MSDLAAQISESAAQLGVALEPSAAEQIAAYLEELLRWNQRINLVGRCTPEQALDRHIDDSLAFLRVLEAPEVAAVEPAGPWYDIGSGAGLPGLVLGLARPASRWILVEPIGKKNSFAQHAAGILGADGVEVRGTRLEHLEREEGPGKALSRATFDPREWAERGADLVGPGGLVIVTMGGAGDVELESRALLVDRLTLPRSGAGRTNVVLRVPGQG